MSAAAPRSTPGRGGGEGRLQQQARAELAAVGERIADVATIRNTLQAALDAGCDDGRERTCAPR